MTQENHGKHSRRARAEQAQIASRSAERARRSARVRRFASLTFLSTLIPGLGLLFTRRRRLGITLLVLALIAGVAASVFIFNSGLVSGAAQIMTKNGLEIALISILVLAALWLTSVAVTARVTHSGNWSRRGNLVHRVFTTLMCFAVAMPAAQAARYVVVTQDAFSKIFTQTGDTQRENAFKKKERVNFLLVGSDAGADRTGVRTDSLMVASVDTKTGDTTLISIPRNLQRVPFPESNPLHKLYPDGFYCPEKPGTCIMDAVWAEAGVEHPELFQGQQYPGLTTTRDVVGEITGLSIDYTTVINLQGFRDLVDAMGGVDVTIPKGGLAIGGKIQGGVISGITGRLPEGPQHLNGQQALWYARSRVETGDGDRMRRQRCMINALVSQANPFDLVQRFPSIMKVAKENVLVDLPQSQLPDLATLANEMKRGKMKSVNLAYPIISDADPDFDKIRELVKKGLERPKTAPKPKAKPAAPSPSTSASTPTPSPSSTQDAVSDTAANC